MVIAPRDFNDTELFETKEELERMGHKVDVASKARGQIKGMHGSIAVPSLQTFDIRTKDYDAIVFVGGSGTTAYFGDREIENLIKDFYSAGKVIAAICIAPHLLAEAGVLEGIPATSYASEHSFLQEKGAVLQQKPVVKYKNIITANGPSAALIFAKSISYALEEQAGKKKISFV